MKGVILTLLASLVVAACSSLENDSTPSPGPTASKLTPYDYEAIADAMSHGLRQYRYKVFSYDVARQKYFGTSGGRFDGLLLTRQLVDLQSLNDGTETDGRFNRMVFASSSTESGLSLRYSLTVTPDGTRIVTLETEPTGEQPPRVMLAGILREAETFTVLGELESLQNLPCLNQAAANGALTDLVDCVRRGPAGGGGGGNSGEDSLGGLVADASGLLAAPDCERDPMDMVSHPHNRRASEVWRRRASTRTLPGACAVFGCSDKQAALDRAYREQVARLREAQGRVADALEELEEVLADENSTAAERRQAQREANAAIETAQREQRRADRARNRLRDADYPVDELEPVEPESVEDPRCAGQRTDGERGTLFTNPDFCDGADPLSCILKQRDSLYGFTDGQCWIEEGPDGAARIVCSGADRLPGGAGPVTPDEIPEVTPCEEGDIDCWSDPVAPRSPTGEIPLRYVDVTPLGALLAVICSKVGCPSPP